MKALRLAGVVITVLTVLFGLGFVYVSIWSGDDRWVATAFTTIIIGIVLGGVSLALWMEP